MTKSFFFMAASMMRCCLWPAFRTYLDLTLKGRSLRRLPWRDYLEVVSVLGEAPPVVLQYILSRLSSAFFLPLEKSTSCNDEEVSQSSKSTRLPFPTHIATHCTTTAKQGFPNHLRQPAGRCVGAAFL